MVEFLGLLPQEGLMVILNMVGFVVMRLQMVKYTVTPKMSPAGIYSSRRLVRSFTSKKLATDTNFVFHK